MGYGGSSPLGPSIDDAATIDAERRMARDSSAVANVISMGERERRARESASSFGEGMLARQPPKRTGLVAAIAALVVLLAGGGVALYVLMQDKGESGEVAANNAAAATGDANAEKPETPGNPNSDVAAGKSAADPNTGFDLIVEPSNVAVKLNGRELATKPPLQIRNLAAGEHIVEISAPAGFFNKTQKVNVETGKAPRVTIELEAMEITGNFTSTPDGAKVILVSDRERTVLGQTPVSTKLNPRKRYEVQFKKTRYVTVTKPVELGSGQTVEVAVNLERAGRDNGRDNGSDRPTVDLGRNDKPDDEPDDKPEADDKPDKPDVADKFGYLALGSKPPCKIFINGRDTGMRTPKKGIKLSAGRHRITLVNNAHGIKERFNVVIKPGQTVKRIKNMADRIK
jgi:hypothetical protein